MDSIVNKKTGIIKTSKNTQRINYSVWGHFFQNNSSNSNGMYSTIQINLMLLRLIKYSYLLYW